MSISELVLDDFDQSRFDVRADDGLVTGALFEEQLEARGFNLTAGSDHGQDGGGDFLGEGMISHVVVVGDETGK